MKSSALFGMLLRRATLVQLPQLCLSVAQRMLCLIALPLARLGARDDAADGRERCSSSCPVA